MRQKEGTESTREGAEALEHFELRCLLQANSMDVTIQAIPHEEQLNESAMVKITSIRQRRSMPSRR